MGSRFFQSRQKSSSSSAYNKEDLANLPRSKKKTSEIHGINYLGSNVLIFLIDPSILYSDKSHSIQQSEVLNHIQSKPNFPILTKKVLSTLINLPETNWPVFLEQLDKVGLDKEDLVIGLKGNSK